MKYGVIETTSIWHEGDERSRTNPGHGYPAYSEDYTTFREFKDEEEMKRFLLSQSQYSHARVIRFEEVKYEKTITLTEIK